MSRQIKFRVYKDYSNQIEFFTLEDALLSKDDDLQRINNSSPKDFEQYTGVKDRNGVEIYEGDLMRCDDGYLWEVKWNELHCGFMAEGEDVSTLSFDAEVIGNIHQNPELLK